MIKIELKSKSKINIMAQGGKILSQALTAVAKNSKQGIKLSSLDKIAEKIITQTNAIPSFIDYKGYPKATCLSVNEEVVHNIPGERKLKNGDILGIDIGVRYRGLCTDAAITIGIGNIPSNIKKILTTCRLSLNKAVKMSQAGNTIGDLGYIIEKTANHSGFNIIEGLSGHGIGKQSQEPPTIFNYGTKSQGLKITNGMCLAIEPMITTGKGQIGIKSDGWGVFTLDKKPAAHFEQTIAIWNNKPIILTQLP